MTPEERDALELVVARTGHGRFRQLCDESHPDYHPGCPGQMLALAAHFSGRGPGAPPVPEPPGVFRKAANFAGAVARHVAAGLAEVPRAEADARLAVCAGCEQFTERRSCRLCGCGMDLKVKWATSHCPLKKWSGD